MGVGIVWTELASAINRRATLTIKLVVIDSTTGLSQDTIEREIKDLELISFTGSMGIEFEFEKFSFMDSPYPIRQYDGETFPGLR